LNAIARYLDAAYPEALTLWPRRDAFEILEVATLVDVALDALINTATRYFGARGDAAWPAIQAEMVLRAQTALDALAARVAKLDRDTIGGGGWSGADMWLYTGVTWLASLPRRASDPNAHANVKQLMTLGFTLPARLVAWADKHSSRPDVMLHG
jgi:glutathione S-transferase